MSGTGHGDFSPRGRGLRFECLEHRLPLAADFGDAPAPYPTLMAENGARHEAIGAHLGSSRDTESNGTHSFLADADGADENGVTFSMLRAGQLGATATVNVQNASGSAKLDAWIDFDGDGNWGGPHEQIADSLTVASGVNAIAFDIPGGAATGTTFARFRLSTVGNLGVGGAASDGEVEDYAVTIEPPGAALGVFADPNVITSAGGRPYSVFAADIDGDSDVDVLTGANSTIAWYENDGDQNFTFHTIATAVNGSFTIFAADVDGDSDVDVLSASSGGHRIDWYENDGTPDVGAWTGRLVSLGASTATSVYAADVDGDGDLDVLSSSSLDDQIAWYENNGAPTVGNFAWAARTITAVANGALSVYAADIDRDGDIDVLSASRDDSKIAWYVNDGTPKVGAWTAPTDRNSSTLNE